MLGLAQAFVPGTFAGTLDAMRGRWPPTGLPQPKSVYMSSKPAVDNPAAADLFHMKRTEWGQQQPATDLGAVSPALDPFVRTNNDVAPTQGMERDGWQPLYNQKWFHAKAAQDLYERRTLGEHGEVDRVFKNNQGVTYQVPGTLNVLPTRQPGCFEKKPWE